MNQAEKAKKTCAKAYIPAEMYDKFRTQAQKLGMSLSGFMLMGAQKYSNTLENK